MMLVTSINLFVNENPPKSPYQWICWWCRIDEILWELEIILKRNFPDKFSLIHFFDVSCKLALISLSTQRKLFPFSEFIVMEILICSLNNVSFETRHWYKRKRARKNVICNISRHFLCLYEFYNIVAVPYTCTTHNAILHSNKSTRTRVNITIFSFITRA